MHDRGKLFAGNALQQAAFLSRGHVPETDRVVQRPDGQGLPIWGQRERFLTAPAPAEQVLCPTRTQVPAQDRLVAAYREQLSAVRGIGQQIDRAAVSAEAG